MNRHEALDWVTLRMPEALDALIRFTELNPNWKGANWDDCLDTLIDSDSHLDVTEPLYEDEYLRSFGQLAEAVAITLLYASREFRGLDQATQARTVRAVIER